MKSYRVNGNTPESLNICEEQMPTLQRGEVLIEVHAVSLNYRDLVLIEGRRLKPTLTMPIPGSDGAGRVIEVGEGVSDFEIGDRVVGAFHPRWFGGGKIKERFSGVYGRSHDGWFTEYKVVSQEAIVALPDELTYEEGATLPCAAVTAWVALTGPQPIKAGETVLTLGTGGVSLFALQYAKAMGARVIATTSSAEKAERLKTLGADEVINYRETPQWHEQVLHLTQDEGVQRVVEVVGPATIGQSLKAAAYDGEVVLVGFLGENGPPLTYFDIMGSGASLRSTSVGDRVALRDCVRATAQNTIKPVIDQVFAFDQAREALAHLKAGRHFGKVVVRVR
ncbi:MAG: zinc-dependent alcohol dehydrogenase family protein [Pseudomonas sp.]|uniref:zinc-dependent alcohol dehydrogenase family protein n=1 Tax=Pseudomonas sp. TaxID=306 RepID=UPI003D6DBC7C